MYRRDFVRGALASLAVGSLSPSTLRALAAPAASLSTASPPVSVTPSTSTPASAHFSPGFTATWIGHSSILLNFNGTRVLCDPVLFNEIGLQLLGQTVGIHRYSAASISIDEMPCPHIVLLSHAHMDHTDLPTLQALCQRFPDRMHCVCARNTKDIVGDLPWRSCRELDWWESVDLCGLSISAVEVLHNGWRYPWEKDRREGYRRSGRSYNAYLIRSADENILFAGDTALCESFRELRNIPISLACMPIGAYAGCSDNHCTPEEAVQMALMMHCRAIAPMHCLTFNQTPEPRDEPMTRFLTSCAHHDLMPAWSVLGATWKSSHTLAVHQCQD